MRSRQLDDGRQVGRYRTRSFERLGKSSLEGQMYRLNSLSGVLGGLAALAATATVALAGSASAQGIAAPNSAPPDNATSQALAGNAHAYIMPAQGYTGSRLIGSLPAGRSKVPTLTYDLQGNLTSAQPPAGLTHYWPDDMGYYGGPVLATVSQVNVYWANDNGSIWGFPATFEVAYNTSNMIELLNHYTFQAKSNGHWPVASYYWYFPGGGPGSLIYDNQVQAEVQALAANDVTNGRQTGVSWSTIYHVFLPPGTDECFNPASNGCYNPNGLAPGPFAFCAYHGYTRLASGEYVAYDVQPYAEVNGCEQSGQGVEAQDQANVLSHETSEAISDPVPGYGWYSEWPTGGGEIGDECAFVPIKQTLTGKVYYIQDEYATAHHECDNAY
jgi:hypothetical protein